MLKYLQAATQQYQQVVSKIIICNDDWERKSRHGGTFFLNLYQTVKP
jgi:hypothetical protein